MYLKSSERVFVLRLKDLEMSLVSLHVGDEGGRQKQRERLHYMNTSTVLWVVEVQNAAL